MVPFFQTLQIKRLRPFFHWGHLLFSKAHKPILILLSVDAFVLKILGIMTLDPGVDSIGET